MRLNGDLTRARKGRSGMGLLRRHLPVPQSGRRQPQPVVIALGAHRKGPDQDSALPAAEAVLPLALAHARLLTARPDKRPGSGPAVTRVRALIPGRIGSAYPATAGHPVQ